MLYPLPPAGLSHHQGQDWTAALGLTGAREGYGVRDAAGHVRLYRTPVRLSARCVIYADTAENRRRIKDAGGTALPVFGSPVVGR